jgi:hypothetical protein
MRTVVKAAGALLVALLFIGTLSPVSASMPPEGIYGYVHDQVTGNPVYNVQVSGGGDSTHTDANGYYFLSIQMSGQFTVSVAQSGGHLSGSGTASINGNNPCPRCDITVARDPAYTISGYIRDQNGVGISGATFCFRAGSLYGPYYSTADDAGFYTFNCANEWTVSLSWYATGYWTQTASTSYIGGNSHYNYDVKIPQDLTKAVVITGVFCTLGSIYTSGHAGAHLYYAASASNYYTVHEDIQGVVGGSSDFTYTFTKTFSGDVAYDSTHIGKMLMQNVEVSGVCTGYPNPAYYASYVLKTIGDPYDAILTSDPTNENQVNSFTSQVGPGSPGNGNSFAVSVTQQGTHQWAVNLDITFTIFGQGVTLKVDRSAGSSQNTNLEVYLTNYYNGILHFHEFLDNGGTSGMILHVWGDSDS